MISIPQAPKTRREWCKAIKKDFPDLRMEVIDYFLFAVMHLVDVKDIERKIMASEKKYGPLSFEGMNPGKEAMEEIIDLFSYVHASRYTSVPL